MTNHTSIRRAAIRGLSLVVVITSLVMASAVVSSTPAGAVPTPDQIYPCGRDTRYHADGTKRACTFADNFDEGLNTRQWTVLKSSDVNVGAAEGCFVDSSSNVEVARGVLSLTTRKLAQPMTCPLPKGASKQAQYTEGEVTTFGKWSQRYGLFEIRAKFPANAVKGTHGAIWMWPDNASKYGAWPLSGEIDVAEVYSQYNDRAIPFIHYNAANQSTVTNDYCQVDVTQFHTYRLDWTPTEITISIDDQPACVHHMVKDKVLPSPAPFDQPFMLNLTQMLGIGANAVDQSKPMTPKTMQVDWVHVWN